MIGSKKRFEILKRDGFACQYCGKKGPDVTLEVDHIVPKSKGGTDDVDNLITCCRECNMGKGKTKLDDSELWKDKIFELNKRIKKDFNKKWNGAYLGEIKKGTYILLCTMIDIETSCNCSPNSVDAREYVYLCGNENFAGEYPRGWNKDDFWKELEKEFFKGGEFCDKCCKRAYNDIMDFNIDKIIKTVCDDSGWTGGTKASQKGIPDVRLNYLLSRWLMQERADIMKRKEEFKKELEQDLKLPYNFSGLNYLVMKHTYRKDRLDHFANGGE